MKHLMGKVTISVVISPDQKRREYRKQRYARLLKNAGIREASIKKYLARGFKSEWSRALSKEMQRLVWDMKYWRGRRWITSEHSDTE